MSTGSGIGGSEDFGDEGPRYITNEFGDVLGTEPRTTGTASGMSGNGPAGNNEHSHINPSQTGVTSKEGEELF